MYGSSTWLKPGFMFNVCESLIVFFRHREYKEVQPFTVTTDLLYCDVRPGATKLDFRLLLKTCRRIITRGNFPSTAEVGKNSSCGHRCRTHGKLRTRQGKRSSFQYKWSYIPSIASNKLTAHEKTLAFTSCVYVHTPTWQRLSWSGTHNPEKKN